MLSSDLDCYQDSSVSGKVLGVRYSEMLPKIWRVDVNKLGKKEGPANGA